MNHKPFTPPEPGPYMLWAAQELFWLLEAYPHGGLFLAVNEDYTPRLDGLGRQIKQKYAWGQMRAMPNKKLFPYTSYAPPPKPSTSR